MWGALIGAGASLLGAASARSTARSNQRAQMQMHQDQMDLSRQQLGFARNHYDWARGEYDDLRGRFDPVLGEMEAQAMRQAQPDYSQISADAALAFDNQQQSSNRQMQRYGISPGEGMWGANTRSNALGRARAEVLGHQSARRQAGNDRYQRLSNLYGVGQSMMNSAGAQMRSGLSGMNSATNTGVNSAGSAARTYGANAQAAGQQAGSLFGSAFNHIGSFVDQYMGQGANQVPNSQVPYYLSNSPGLNQPGAPQPSYMNTPWTPGGP